MTNPCFVLMVHRENRHLVAPSPPVLTTHPPRRHLFLPGDDPDWLTGWMTSGQAVWLASWLACYMAGKLAGERACNLAGRLAGSQDGWRAGCVAGWFLQLCLIQWSPQLVGLSLLCLCLFSCSPCNCVFFTVFVLVSSVVGLPSVCL